MCLLCFEMPVLQVAAQFALLCSGSSPGKQQADLFHSCGRVVSVHEFLQLQNPQMPTHM